MNAKAKELLQDKLGPIPIWIRPPKSGPEFYTGLSRSKLYLLGQEGKIRTVSIREPGQIKGTRLFDLRSVLTFIEKNEAESEKMEVAK